MLSYKKTKTAPVNMIFFTSKYKEKERVLDQPTYPYLQPKTTLDFARTVTRTILGRDIVFYSANPTLVEYKDHYLLNLRWINYQYYEDGSKKTIPNTWISLNSRFRLNQAFHPISDEQWLTEDFEQEKDRGMMGIEDLRIFKTNVYTDDYVYLATSVDPNRKVVSVASNVYSLEDPYTLVRTIMTPSFYDLKNLRVEKNWTFVLYLDKVSVVYAWFPLQIGVFVNTSLHLISTKPMPIFFKDARGSTSGYRIEQQIWFVLHKSMITRRNRTAYYYYQHFFAVFDLSMNLIRYSELFKLGDKPVEFCTSLILKENECILSYSVLDTIPNISVYDMKVIQELKWVNA
jgi:hypothetical protein